MIRVMLAATAAFAAMFLLAGLFTGVLARDFIAQNVEAGLLRAPPNMSLILIGYLLLALLMTTIYRAITPTTTAPLRRGLLFGLGSAVCWLMPYSLVLFGAYTFPYAALPLDFSWALVEQGAGGVLIGAILGRSPRHQGPRKKRQ